VCALCGFQAATTSVQPQMNVSFGIEFDDDMMCAVDKLERAYVLKEAPNSSDLVTETSPRPNQDVQCHRKEKYSRRKADGNVPSSSRSKIRSSSVDSSGIKSETAEDAMSLTVIKGHDSNKVVSSAHDEGGDQDVLCTWNSPLLVSTPAVVGSRRCIAKENNGKSDGAAAAESGLTVTPKQRNFGRKSKKKNAEKTKLFVALLNASLNGSSPTDPPGRQNGTQSPVDSGRCGSLSDGKVNSLSAISDADCKLQQFYFSVYVSHVKCLLPPHKKKPEFLLETGK